MGRNARYRREEINEALHFLSLCLGCMNGGHILGLGYCVYGV